MAKTLVDLDDDALRAVAHLLGTTTKKDTINQALNAVIAEHERVVALRSEIARGCAGYYAGVDDDSAWR